MFYLQHLTLTVPQWVYGRSPSSGSWDEAEAEEFLLNLIIFLHFPEWNAAVTVILLLMSVSISINVKSEIVCVC